MKGSNETPRIYVACLAAYNNGKLHGQWIDVSDGEDAVWDQIREVLGTSPEPDAEEHAIHDYEGFCGLRVEEYDSVETVIEKAEFAAEFGRLGAELVEHYSDMESARRAMEDQYAGCFPSIQAFAEEITEETSQIPDNLAFYIDYEKMARDLLVNDILAIRLGYEETHIFWQH